MSQQCNKYYCHVSAVVVGNAWDRTLKIQKWKCCIHALYRPVDKFRTVGKCANSILVKKINWATFNASATKPTITRPDLLHLGVAMLPITLTDLITSVLSDIVGSAHIMWHETFLFFFPFMPTFVVLIMLASSRAILTRQRSLRLITSVPTLLYPWQIPFKTSANDFAHEDSRSVVGLWLRDTIFWVTRYSFLWREWV